MNLRLVFRICGRLLLVEAVTMLISLLVSLWYGEDPAPFLKSILIVAAVGLVLALIPAQRHFFVREGFFTAGMLWILMGLGGALPFWFCGQFPTVMDCVFESFSGFTTTGATILTNIEALPKGILFWRSFTHWVGGIGVLSLSLIVLPSLGAKSQFLTQAESTGPIASKLVPKQSRSSIILYVIYISLTLAEIALLLLAGMPLYDAVLTAFSSAGTGGFSNMNLSIAAYQNPACEMIIAVFLVLFSLNLGLFFLMVCRRFKEVWRNDELRFFLGAVALSTVIIAVNILPMYRDLGTALRYSFFQVASIISSTGFATADFTHWPLFSQTLLVILMICGACSCSTGGGIKWARVVLLLRNIRREIHRIVHPRSVVMVRLDGKAVGDDTIRSALVFISAYFLIAFFATLLVALDDQSFSATFTGVLACLSNTGPGLAEVGPYGSFQPFSSFSKLILSLCMVLGRLEIMPILVLFSRNAWKKT